MLGQYISVCVRNGEKKNRNELPEEVAAAYEALKRAFETLQRGAGVLIFLLCFSVGEQCNCDNKQKIYIEVRLSDRMV